jgi:hypothetical protein
MLRGLPDLALHPSQLSGKLVRRRIERIDANAKSQLFIEIKASAPGEWQRIYVKFGFRGLFSGGRAGFLRGIVRNCFFNRGILDAHFG